LHALSSALLLARDVHFWGMTIGEGCRISRSARLDPTHSRCVHIGDHKLVSFDAAILTHDFVGGRHLDTFIGSHCFIGARGDHARRSHRQS
jgi:acetyltransferase-like isoleucine patch superfamily enzyme